MKKFYTFLLLFSSIIFSLSNCFSQTTIVLQPDEAPSKDANVWNTQPLTISNDTCISEKTTFGKGKSALVWDYSPNTNYGIHPDFTGNAWTHSGTPTIGRCLMDIDLQTIIPTYATIISAALYLYHDNSTFTTGHSTISGSNDCWLRRITSPWNENTVTWNTQPSYTTTNEVHLPASTNDTMNYPNIDVTNLVIDMWNNPSTSYGFIIMLNTEQYYRSMLFGSNNCADSTKRPLIIICYHLNTSVPETETTENNSFSLFPNPVNNLLSMDYFIEENSNVMIDFYSVTGKLIDRINMGYETKGKHNLKYTFNPDLYPAGIYIVKLTSSNNSVVVRKIFKE